MLVLAILVPIKVLGAHQMGNAGGVELGVSRAQTLLDEARRFSQLRGCGRTERGGLGPLPGWLLKLIPGIHQRNFFNVPEVLTILFVGSVKQNKTKSRCSGTVNPCTVEAEAGGPCIPGQPGLHNETLSLDKIRLCFPVVCGDQKSPSL